IDGVRSGVPRRRGPRIDGAPLRAVAVAPEIEVELFQVAAGAAANHRGGCGGLARRRPLRAKHAHVAGGNEQLPGEDEPEPIQLAARAAVGEGSGRTPEDTLQLLRAAAGPEAQIDGAGRGACRHELLVRLPEPEAVPVPVLAGGARAVRSADDLGAAL